MSFLSKHQKPIYTASEFRHQEKKKKNYKYQSSLIQLGVSTSELWSSMVALNPKSLPGLNDDFSSSADWVVLILLSFTFRSSWYWRQNAKELQLVAYHEKGNKQAILKYWLAFFTYCPMVEVTISSMTNFVTRSSPIIRNRKVFGT